MINAEETTLLKEYRSTLFTQVGYISLNGMPLPKNESGVPTLMYIPIDKIYIQIRTKEINYRQTEEEKERTSNQGFTERYPLYDLSEKVSKNREPELLQPLHAIFKYKKIIVIGAPGSGKSTLIRYVGNKFSQNLNGPVPILFSLADYAKALDQNSLISVKDFAVERSTMNTNVRDLLLEKIKRGEVLWLIDGLDEAHDWAENIINQVMQLPGQLLLTSRPTGYLPSGLAQIKLFEMVPISPKDVSFFINNLLDHIAQILNRSDEWKNQRKNWLNQQLESNPRLKPLTGNPLLLTFFAILACEDLLKDLPSRRSDIYRRYCEELFTSWEVNHKRQGDTLNIAGLEGEEARRFLLDGLYTIGWLLHFSYYSQPSDLRPTKHRLIDLLCDYYKDIWKDSPIKLAESIIEFWLGAGILITTRYERQDYLVFRHLTFEEYGAAWELSKMWEKNPNIVWGFLMHRLHDPAWREVVLLMGGLISDYEFDSFIKYIRQHPGELEEFLYRNAILAGELIVERQSSKHEEKLLKDLKSLLMMPFYAPQKITDILKKMGDSSIPTLIDVLRTPQLSTFIQVASTLAELKGEKAIPYFMESFDDDDYFPPALVDILGNIGGSAIVPYITSGRFPQPDSAVSIHTALGKVGTLEVLPLLYTGIEGARPPTIESAIEAFTEIDPAISIPFLEEKEKEGSDRASIALGAIRIKQMLIQLNSLLADEISGQSSKPLNPSIKQAINFLLSSYGELDLTHGIRILVFEELSKLSYEQINSALGKDTKTILDTLAESDITQFANSSDWLPYLVARLKYSTSYSVYELLEHIGKLSGETVLPILINYLHSKDSKEVEAAIDVIHGIYPIEGIGGDEIKNELLSLLDNSDLRISFPAAITLARSNDSRAISYLFDFVSSSKDDYQKRQAIEVLINDSEFDRILPFLSKALADKKTLWSFSIKESLVQHLYKTNSIDVVSEIYILLKSSFLKATPPDYYELGEYQYIESAINRLDTLLARSKKAGDPFSLIKNKHHNDEQLWLVFKVVAKTLVATIFEFILALAVLILSNPSIKIEVPYLVVFFIIAWIVQCLPLLLNEKLSSSQN